LHLHPTAVVHALCKPALEYSYAKNKSVSIVVFTCDFGHGSVIRVDAVIRNGTVMIADSLATIFPTPIIVLHTVPS